jgi:outer membrane protein assembly factor BamB
VTRHAALIGILLAVGGCTEIGDRREGKFVAPVDVLQVRWQRHLTEEPLIEYKPQEFAAAAVRDDGSAVYVGSSAGSLWAFDARSGGILWRKALEGGIGSQPRYVEGEQRIFVGTLGGALYCLDAATGKERWIYRVKGPIESQPTFADGIVYFTSGENRVYALDAHKGVWKWQYDRESPDGFTIRGYGAPLVVNGRVYVGFSDGYLACIAAGTGDVVWARPFGGEATRFVDVDSTPLFYNGTLYISSYTGGVYALDPKDGSVRWRYEVEGAGSLRAARGRLYFSAARWGLHCLDLDGHVVWKQSLSEAGELSAPVLLGGYVMVSAAGGGTYVADSATGRLCQFFAPGHGVTSAPATDGRQVYVLSNGGYFYALALATSAGPMPRHQDTTPAPTS